MSWFGQSREAIERYIEDRSNIKSTEIQNYIKFKSNSANPVDILKFRAEMRKIITRIMITTDDS